ncbi:helix-turn-helix domain-containing protein [Amycolatopsis sp. EV170708-02-1]|uniref:helix-turn-helix domain-containing protein n=1 Tax=Amycolatopsis sp. EV170708-02-1 TaxID=2919322 RepID=UPI001F0BA224|nr:hypothetical protein [Amycolatopsis sp. EV170708-02-1]UMP07112.1 hypothetical protein MJQ72_20855 [Amycolatopsis sp. EV170708-02-1]
MTENDDDPQGEPAELARLYNDGATIESLAKRYALSYQKVRTTLLAAGVTLRPPKIQLPPTPPGLVNAYLAGRSIRQLAAIHGMSYNQTRRILLAEGIVLRPADGNSRPDPTRGPVLRMGATSGEPGSYVHRTTITVTLRTQSKCRVRSRSTASFHVVYRVSTQQD